MKCSPDRFRRRRGQATTEFVIGTLLFLPVVFYAIWVGEAFAVGAKAQEAEITAMWDATAYRIHDYDRGTRAVSRLNRVANHTEQQVTRLLRDLDSFDDSGRSHRNFVGGRGTLRLQCRHVTDQQLDNRENAPGMTPFASLRNDDEVTNYLQKQGTVACFARATYEASMLPRSLLQQFSKHDLFEDGVRNGFDFYGTGGSDNGYAALAGGTPRLGAYLLLDDWAVEEGNQRGERVTSDSRRDSNRERARNKKFFNLASKVSVMKPSGETVTRQQLEEVNTVLLGGNPDRAWADAFKLSLHLGVDERRPFDPDEGERRPYLLPHDDGEGGIPALDRLANQRVRGNYLGHRNANFLGN